MRYIYLVILLILNHLAYSQCDSNLFINGSFTNIEGANITASGWTSTSTPDINDEFGTLNTSIGYLWTGTPIASPPGGTWQNLYGKNESIAQTVNLTVGQAYTICFDYAAQGIYSTSYTFTKPIGINVYIDGILSYTSISDTTQYTWESACFNFTASNANTLIKFSPSDTSYVAIDGACLQQAVQTSIENLTEDKSEILVSPNPFLTSTTIKFDNPQNNPFTFILYNFQGKVAHTASNITTDQFIFERNHLTQGIYFFLLRGESQRVSYRGRLVIK